jgi:hypothetical protein
MPWTVIASTPQLTRQGRKGREVIRCFIWGELGQALGVEEWLKGPQRERGHWHRGTLVSRQCHRGLQEHGV